jgi:amidase
MDVRQPAVAADDTGCALPSDLWRLSASQAVTLLRRGAVSPTELVQAALARIAQADRAINALPTVCAERALQRARDIESGEGAHQR